VPGAVIDKVRTLLGLRPPAPAPGIADAGLRTVIDEVATAWPFSAPAIEVSPPVPGVYFLYRDGRLVYIGLAVNGAGIREALNSHQRGAYGECTRAATSFIYQLTENPRALYLRCLDAHRERYGGRLPSCQQGLG
jgi:hypothetical protein